MSFIRCLSNPEGLYIIMDRRGRVEFLSHSFEKMPWHVFRGLLRRWFNGMNNTQFRGGSILQIESGPNQWRWSLTYKGWKTPIVMWETTLVYICVTNSGILTHKDLPWVTFPG